ncbi:MAG TPA: hypothetical protein DDY68_03015 [Porphyromonadaceae bacterium]|nr:hypothetical protein [Porphyromonadaceae bacterium]
MKVEIEISPFSINDEKDTITNLMNANGGKPLLSHRESIEYFGWSNDVNKTLMEIEEDEKRDEFEAYN